MTIEDALALLKQTYATEPEVAYFRLVATPEAQAQVAHDEETIARWQHCIREAGVSDDVELRTQILSDMRAAEAAAVDGLELALADLKNQPYDPQTYLDYEDQKHGLEVEIASHQAWLPIFDALMGGDPTWPL